MIGKDDVMARLADRQRTDGDGDRRPGQVVPGPDDLAGLCGWLTATFELDPRHPIIRPTRYGLVGPEAQVALTRAGAPEIRFDPITRVNTPAKLIETLNSYMLPTDGAVPAFKSVDCRNISHVVRMLCGATEAIGAADEAEGIVGTFLASAVALDACTIYGTAAQRYEAACSLRREIDPTTGRPCGPRYLIDTETSELVIAVAELADAARRHNGGSVPRGWLTGRMQTLGWRRVTIDGHAETGRQGRSSHHARVGAYVGHLPDRSADEETAP